MKKKLLAAILSVSMVAAMLVGCGGKADTNNAASTNEAAGTEAADTTDGTDAPSEAAQDVDYGTGSITIWVAEGVGAFTQDQVDNFMAENPQFAGYTVTIEAVGEGDAASNMITDVEAGADIFGFAQDQMARLVSSGAVSEIIGDYANFVASNNDAGAVSAAKMGDAVYAFPVTSDNGYFMYYDSSVITDPSSLDAIIADCEAANKGFYMEINSGWYQTAFFFGTGCELTYDTDNDGNFVKANTDYASDKGVAALKAMINLSNSKAFYNGSDVSNATNAAAIVSGTWNSDAAKELFGDNYACAKLPSFTVDGSDYQFSGFGGFKLLGVKPQTDTNKAIVCLELAQYLSSADVQLARYNEVGWGPSNLEAQNNDAVKADEALSALAEQLAYTIPQGQYPNDYWSLATALGDDVIADKYDNASDDELLSALQEFQATCESYAQ